MTQLTPLPNQGSSLTRLWRVGFSKNGQRLIVIVGLLLLWQGYVWVSAVPPLLLPGPGVVLQTLIQETLNGTLLGVTFNTLLVLFQGLAIGVVVGTGLVLLANSCRLGRTLVEVLTAILSPLPGVAVLPLLMIWFGLTSTSLILAVVLATTWPIALNMDTGFATIHPTIVMVGRNLGLSRFQQIRDVMLMAALPSILTGIRTAWAFGWRTVIAAELIFGVAGSAGGLAWYINDSRYYLRTPNVFAGLVMIAVLGILLDAVFLAIEHRTIEKWGMKRH
jgi:NitT/TauT family transport system permease protein